MNDLRKTKRQLIQELDQIRQRIAGLEAGESEHEQAASAVRKGEEMAQTLLDAFPGPALLVDPEGMVLALNERMAKSVGKPRPELVGARILELFTPEVAAFRKARLQQAVRSLAPVHFEERRAEKAFESTCVPIPDSHGNVERVAVFSRDVTELKRRQEALRRNEETVRTLLNAPPDLAMLLDPQGRILALNRAAAGRLGGSPDKLVGKCVFDFLPPELAESRRSRLNEVVRSRVPLRLEDERGGVVFDGIGSPVFDDHGNVEYVAVFSRDVTGRKRWERSLQESVRTLRTLLNAPPDLAMLLDPRGRILALNEAAAGKFGGSPDEFVGTCVFGLLPPEVADLTKDRLEEAVRSKTVVHLEDERGGLVFHSIVSPVLDDDGNVECVAVFVREVTHRRQAEQLLRESEETVRALLNATSDSAFLFDLDGRMLALNNIAAERLGKRVDQLLGRCVYDELPRELAESRRARLNQVVRSKAPVRFEEERAGIVFDSMCFPVFDADGEVRRAAVLARDVTARKRMEELLRQSEETVRALLNATPDAAVLLDLDGTILTVNEGAAVRLGKPRDELVGTCAYDLFPPETVQFQKSIVDRVTRSKQMLRFDEQLNGMFFDTTCYPICDARGTVKRFGIFAREVTKRRQMEQSLRESEETVRALLNATPDAAMLLDLQGAILALNEAAAARLGKPLEQLVGTCVFGLYTPEVAGQRRTLLNDVVRSETPLRFEEEEAGIVFDTTCLSISNARGTVERVAVFSRDITDRRQMEDSLRESEETVRALLNATPDAALLLDAEGTVLTLNEAAAARAGKSQDDLVGACAFDFFPPELIESKRAIVDRVTRGNELLRLEEEYAGTIFDTTCYPIPDADGSVRRFGVFARDVTDRKQAEAAIRREQRRLRRLLEMYERDRKLVAYEIHDGFAQPLAGALMNLESSLRLLHQQCPDASQHGFDTALQLMRETLREARRLMGGLRPAMLEEYGLASAIDNLVEESHLGRQPEIEYSRAVQFDRLPVPLETAIFRIVQEALANACRHSKSSNVRLALIQQGNRIRVEVEDWGIGFEPGKVGMVCFGLEGLRERARLFGGRASIDSAPGKGTRVVVELPLESAEE